MLSLQTNPMDLAIQRNLAEKQNIVSESLKRMSTGYKVNSAKDDAAGLYVATGLNTQLRGLKQAQKNTLNGISYLNIAEGSLTTMTSILNRLRDLSVQAANGVYDTLARGAMQSEVDSLIKELQRIKTATTFNGLQIFGEEKTPTVTTASTFSMLRSNNAQISGTIQTMQTASTMQAAQANKLSTITEVANTAQILDTGGEENISAANYSVSPLAEGDPQGTITGVFNFSTLNEVQEVLIDNVKYTLTNLKSGTNSLSYEKNLETGQITFLSNYIKIEGQKDVAHNININGSYNQIYTGDLADYVTRANTTSIQNRIYLGAGDDVADMIEAKDAHADYNFVYGEDGDDKINAAAFAYGGNGIDTLTNCGYTYGGADDDILENCGTAEGEEGNDRIYGGLYIYGGEGNDIITSTRNDAYIEGGNGDDNIIIESGVKNNTVDGGAGTNTITDNGTNTIKMNVPGENAKFIHIEANSTIDAVIDGKTYTVQNQNGSVKNLIYKIENGQIQFLQANKIKIWGQKDVAHNVHIEHGTFYGGDLDDVISTHAGYIYGGKGNDRLTATSYFAEAHGEEGDDIIYAGGSRGKATGGDGKDTIYVNDWSDVNAGAGDDTIYVNKWTPFPIYGGDGNDTFIVKDGVSGAFIDGQSGTNTVINGEQSYTANVEDANGAAVTLNGKETKTLKINGITYTVTGGTNNQVTVIAGLDKVTGQIVFSTTDTVHIYGQSDVAHNVRLDGYNLNFYGGDLDDKIELTALYCTGHGGKGNDYITAVGHNNIYGDDGDDTLIVQGASSIYGGDGNDTLTINNNDNGAHKYDPGNGDDVININSKGINITTTGSGNKIYNINKDNCSVEGGTGADTFNISSNGNTVRGMNGDDYFLVTGKNNYIDGGSGVNYVVNAGTDNTVINLIADPNSGILDFTYKGEVKTFEIHGKTYTVTNENADGTAPASNRLTYNYNFITGELILTGSDLTIDSPLESENHLFIFGDNNTINGGNKDDNITVQSGTNNIIHGGNGNDNLTVKTENNSVYGDDGNDTLNIDQSSSSHAVSGGNGNDTINVTSNQNTNVTGDDGEDNITVSGKNNIIDAGADNDIITVTNTNNKVSASSGSNNFFIESDNNTITGGIDTDTISIKGNNNTVDTQDGDDNLVIYGNTNNIALGSGNDTIEVNGASNDVSATDGKNKFTINGNENSVIGGNGNDTITLRGDQNTATGGAGNDNFTIKRGNQNNIDGNDGYNTMMNYGTNTIFTNVVDLTNAHNIVRLQVGANGDEASAITFDTSFTLGGLEIDLSTPEKAAASILEVDDVMTRIEKKLAQIGALQNRLESVMKSQTSTIENYTAAKSTILDADIAEESAKYVKNSILSNISAALMTQSRRVNAQILTQLLR